VEPVTVTWDVVLGTTRNADLDEPSFGSFFLHVTQFRMTDCDGEDVSSPFDRQGDLTNGLGSPTEVTFGRVCRIVLTADALSSEVETPIAADGAAIVFEIRVGDSQVQGALPGPLSWVWESNEPLPVPTTRASLEFRIDEVRAFEGLDLTALAAADQPLDPTEHAETLATLRDNLLFSGVLSSFDFDARELTTVAVAPTSRNELISGLCAAKCDARLAACEADGCETEGCVDGATQSAGCELESSALAACLAVPSADAYSCDASAMLEEDPCESFRTAFSECSSAL
jgi:hypothetical protein